jgi:hypothetical protein
VVVSAPVKLCPATLRWLLAQWAEAQRPDGEPTMFDHFNEGPTQSVPDVMRSIERRAEEAESRPPLLSDWVAAAEGSKLGVPHPGTADGNWALFFGTDDAFGPYVTFPETGATLYPTDAFRSPSIDCTTPAALRAALDALAGES